jgi:hypothetical protein
VAGSATSIASSIPTSTFLTPAAAAATYAPVNNPTFTGNLTAPYIISSSNANSGFSWFDRTVPATEWVISASGGVASFYNTVAGAAVLGLTNVGVLSINGLGGTTTNSNAIAGCVGEYIAALNGSGTAMVSGVTVNLASISLTPGDWDVWGEVWCLHSGTATALGAGINTVSASLPAGPALNTSRAAWSSSTTADAIYALSPCRMSLAASTTVYMSAIINGTTATGYGSLKARRAR